VRGRGIQIYSPKKKYNVNYEEQGRKHHTKTRMYEDWKGGVSKREKKKGRFSNKGGSPRNPIKGQVWRKSGQEAMKSKL